MPELDGTLFGIPQPWGLVALLAAAMVLMYLGRSAAHGALRGLSACVQNVFVLLAGGVQSAQQRLVQRNREVLLEMGREASERVIEREFDRVNWVVARDLSGYPALHRKLSDQIAQIDDDYRQSTEVPPALPAWIGAVESIARIPSNGDPVVGRILGDIHKTLSQAERSAIGEYRTASRKRHHLLSRMLPVWRRLDRTLDRVDGTIRGLGERSQVIDQQMDQYDEIRAKSDRAVRMLSASSMSQFVAAGIVLAIALMGGFVNFHLIALPMSEMVGATSYVGPVPTSDIAALVIILTEVAMGLFLMESLRITRLFPVIHTMDDSMRRRMIWVSFGILFTLACVESSLAYMRDLLAADREALTASLAGLDTAPAQFRWIPSIGQMVMGFMLPFALAFAAIPLESFIHSCRVVGGSALAGCLSGLAALLELAASLSEQIGPMLVHVYDFAIVIPLRIEQLVCDRGRPRAAHPKGVAHHEAL
jgi:hypothetical protein